MCLLLGQLGLLGGMVVPFIEALGLLGLQGVLRWHLCLRWRAVLSVVFVLYVVPGENCPCFAPRHGRAVAQGQWVG